MAYQVGLVCYGTPQEAASAVASGESGKLLEAGSVVYVVDAAAGSDGSITYTLTDTAGVQPEIVKVQTPTLPECALLQAGDGLVIGWLIATAWLVTFAVLSMRKAL